MNPRSFVPGAIRRMIRQWWPPPEVRAVNARVKKSERFLRSLKDKYKGRRGFVIGNGPSLRVEDLEQIADEISIASNKIYLAFDKTRWRPTLYTIVDTLVWEKIALEVNGRGLTPIIPSYLEPKPIRLHTVRHLGNAPLAWLEAGAEQFSDDLTKGSYGGHTVTFENLQLACFLGLDPIFLIGCDHFYAGEDSRAEANHPIKASAAKNHFIDNYRAVGEAVNPAPIREMTIAYEVAARFASQHGRTILNATRGGHLEAFPRCDFESLFLKTHT
jgi:hypothetical protein